MDWMSSVPGPAWALVGLIATALLYYVGDKHWQQKPKEGREFAIAPTKEEERAAKLDHDRETIRLCNEVYVQRERYHKDMDVVTAEVQRVRADVQSMGLTIATMGANLTTLAEASKEQGAFLREIVMHTKELNERDARWKPHLGVPASVDISPR